MRGQGADETVVPFKGTGRHHFFHQIAADDRGTSPRLVDQRGVVEIGRREDAGHGSANAESAHQGPRVDALDADDVIAEPGNHSD